MLVIDLDRIDGTMAELAGGKAVGLAKMIKAGERVPAGFCLTTEAHKAGTVPLRELAAAYERLGGGPVAVRSSATAEDLPEASFAGQQDTVLGVVGVDELASAVQRCWDSLHSERAVAYRRAAGIGEAHMAVVVQRMVEPALAGVLFTADPVTGSRTDMVVNAVAGLGDALVDGRVAADQAVPDQVREELLACGGRLQDHFGCPQDIEWALDHDGVLWLLQSRPITTLFPAPPPTDRPGLRVYLELGGQFQGVLRPFTPMGISAIKVMAARMSPRTAGDIVDIAGRLYIDLTDLVRDANSRKWLPSIVATDLGPRVAAVLDQVLADPRFAPLPGHKGGPAGLLKWAVRGLIGVTRALARPDAARARAFRGVERFKRASTAPACVTTSADRLTYIEGLKLPAAHIEDLFWPLMAGVLSAAAPAPLLKGVATEAEVNTVLGGMPHNVTVEMDLAIWGMAARAGTHRELLRDTPPARLAAMHHEGTLPDVGLSAFLARYGHRAAAEIDIGLPRWEEDPAPVFAAIANYLRVVDPDQAPDRRFARAAAQAEATRARIVRRARRRRPIRGTLAGFFLGRARSLAGLREAGKFAGLYPMRETRRHLLLVGEDLAGRGLLDRAEDIMFLDLGEAGGAVHDGADHRELIAARKAAYQRELRRGHVPIAMLSDGTDVEALRPPAAPAEGTLVGMAAAPGRATGPARVVHDPADARVEPGEILVAPTTDPGWTPLFLTAAGLVTEIGAPLAHGPTVAREYGIPAVISVRDATREIRTGQIITVDGAAGTVLIAENAP
ncbi:PEP/pyruvate-binding domain-containing protein [Sinosporangium siamense]|uniref:PEP/pyruvate-binding domain-containing protein n=1 Tax=Sinosporangium siamense TaxID=1367973 RepID=UPI0019516170|nr:PEP/pyruvate-binding domain-containing protein [Sinosporangium siamense]